MVRISEETVAWARLLIGYIVHAFPNLDVRDVLNAERDRIDRLDEISNEDRLTLHFIQALEDGTWSIKEISDLIKELSTKQDSSNEKRLVDIVIEALQKPMGRELLGGRTLKDLRRALLNADELAGLEDRIKQAHGHCAVCGRDLIHGEMATVTIDGDGAGLTIRCTHCYKPVFAACGHPDCNNQADIRNKVQFLSSGKVLCEDHKGKKEAPQQGQGIGMLNENAPLNLNLWQAQVFRTPRGARINPDDPE
jgi:hypothetical protein